MVNFAEMRKNKNSSLAKLKEQIKKVTQTHDNSEDTRFWKVSRDKAGNGYAVIRFLPAPGNEDIPFITMYDHFFKGPNGYYVENSLTTINKADPVSEFNSKLWNSVSDDNAPERKQARAQKRKMSYISNIYVVDDPANPDNNGKVFLFRYGKKIFDKLQDAQTSEDEDEEAFDPFNLWLGANFKLKVQISDGWPNYDKSKFSTPTPLSDDEDELKKIFEKEYSLQEFLDVKNFKTYEELEARLKKVLGDDSAKNSDEEEADEPKKKETPARKKKETPPKETYEETVTPSEDEEDSDDEDDEDLKFFESLNDD